MDKRQVIAILKDPKGAMYYKEVARYLKHNAPEYYQIIKDRKVKDSYKEVLSYIEDKL